MQSREPAPIEAKALQYHGGPVMHSSNTYVIYWDPIGNYRGDWERLIDRYFQDVGAASGRLEDVFAVTSQYRDGGGPAANQTTFRGSYKDEDAYPESGCNEPPGAVCLNDAQIKAELQHVIGSGVLPGATGPPVYYLLTPPGVTVCTGAGSASTCSNSEQLQEEVEKEEAAETGICGYHSEMSVSGSPTPYAVQPWIAGDAGFVKQLNPLLTYGATADVLNCQNGVSLQEPNQIEGLNPFGDYAEGLADVIIGDLSVEQGNLVVDPFFDGWYQSGSQVEQGDMCQRAFGPPPAAQPQPNPETKAANLSNETINGHPYYVQWSFNSSGVSGNHAFECWSAVTNEPFFTAPNPVNVGDVVGFNGTESLVTLDAKASGLGANEPLRVPVYSWDFGDGTSASGANLANVFHTYSYGGSYEARLTIADGGGNTNTTTRTIVVDGPPPPAPPGPPSSNTSPSAGGGSSTNDANGKSGGGAGATGSQVQATQAVSTHSLSSALRNGLVVRYSVSAQATGRFEVLLASSIARKIGLHGPSATGLAKGTPAQIVIAKAILVTKKGGHSSYRIRFSKAAAAKLRKLRKVSLMIRMVVHNASSPVATTVLSTASLSH